MKRKVAAFTLIELVTATAIVAIGTALALPAFSAALQRNRTGSAMNLLGADIAMARTTAITRHIAIVVCPRGSGDGCRDDSDWSSGWLVFADADGNRSPDTKQDLLRSEDAPTAADSAYRLVSSRPFLRYQRDGRSAHSNLTIHVCVKSKIDGQVIVNNTGRMRISRQKAGSACPAA
ncbi:MAG: GspH/FimT family pseudopilin [Luteimonas sp.]